jgi:hypothetical protein
LSLSAIEGESFLIALDGFSSDARGDYQLSIERIEPVECDALDAGSALGVVAEGRFVDSMADFEETTDCSGGSRRIPFLWQAPYDGYFEFSALGSSFDTVLVLRQACGTSSLVCNDDYDDVTSQVEWELLEGESVVVELSIFGDDPGSGNPAAAIRELANYTYRLSVAEQ